MVANNEKHSHEGSPEVESEFDLVLASKEIFFVSVLRTKKCALPRTTPDLPI